MRYRITPLNIFCVLLIGIEIYILAFPKSIENETYGYQHIYLIPVILVGLLIDFVFQILIKKYYWLLLIESLLITTTILLNIRLD